jgi:hypothetical protein
MLVCWRPEKHVANTLGLLVSCLNVSIVFPAGHENSEFAFDTLCQAH